MPRRSTGPVDLAGVRLPDVRSGVITDLGTLTGVVVAIRHHG
jgi:hypothetical protein